MNAFSTTLVAVLLATTGIAAASHPGSQLPHLHDDVARDGQADIIFRGGTALAFWQLGSPMGGAVVVNSAYLGDAGPGYSVVAVSDFDGDRSADVLWSNGSHLMLWINDGRGNYTPVSIGNYGGGWQPFAAGDINGDGRSDLFFRSSTHIAYWLMDGARVIRSSYAGDGGAGYRVVAIADFTGRNPDRSRSVDVLWTNGSQLKMWVSDAASATFRPHALGSYGGGWEPFAAGDVNGDHIADILFRGGTHIAYWQQRYAEVFSGFDYESRYAGDGGAGFRAISVSEYGVSENDDFLSDILWSNGSEIKLWLGHCLQWDWDTGCVSPLFLPHPIGTYGGGWQPLEMLIPPG